jgi:ribonuclease Z
MRIHGISPGKITKVIISHFHADHVLGLGGFLRNLEANEYKGTLEIFGPKGLEKFYNNIVNSAYYGNGLKVKLTEIKNGSIIKSNKFTLETVELDHSVASFGFIFKENDKRKMNMEYLKKIKLTQHPILGDLQKGKDIVWEGKKVLVKNATKLISGKKIGFIFDTGVCQAAIKVAKDADLVVSESTFSTDQEEEARSYKHLTSEDAAKIAKKAKAKRLILTHFSQRYKDVSQLEKQAKKIFKETIAAQDFLEIDI